MNVYSDRELMVRFMMNWKPAKRFGSPLWTRVMTAFACGSNMAIAICQAHNMDPDMMVKQRRL